MVKCSTIMSPKPTMTCTKLTLLTLAALSIQIVGLSLFVFGFFPVKPALDGVSGPESYSPPGSDPVPNQTESRSETDPLPPHLLKSLYQELSGIPPLFDRLVLMVIDGLPAEFVLGKDGQPPRQEFKEAMPFIQSLLSGGKAIGYHAKAAPPTVTMPRLKAMVSGAIGGFLDVALNFNTQALLDDNLLAQLFRIGWKMVMLGDETWLKLFPGLFMRHDGVSSFYVKDTVQVDQNVSRHLMNELYTDDWNLLILHYLGLDHVGHVGGRNSVLMAPKLKEMDEVVKTIYLSTVQTEDNTSRRRTLLVVVSDHGMTETGNHGGCSHEETDSLALFLGLQTDASNSKSAIFNTVHQVDIAPTLALLLGVPIPKNNVGVLISEAFGSLTDEKQLRALELNSWQLFRLVQDQLPSFPGGSLRCNCLGSMTCECNDSMEKRLCCLYMNAVDLHRSWKSKKYSGSEKGDGHSTIVAAYAKFLETASEWLSRRVTDKPVSLLGLGIMALALACLILISITIILDREVYPVKWENVSSSNKLSCKGCLEQVFILGIVFIVVMSMGSSSMVEEEQYIWHFLISTSYLLLLRKAACSFSGESAERTYKLMKRVNERNGLLVCCVILLALTGRILRGWHQGGVNWVHLPDISKWLEQAGGDKVKAVQIASCLFVIVLGLCALTLSGSRKLVNQVVGFLFLVSGFFVVWHVLEYQENFIHDATSLVKFIYAILGSTAIGSVVAVPWLLPICDKHPKLNNHTLTLDPLDAHKFPLLEHKDSSYLIGLVYMLCWCLLQLLLQQPINSFPIFLLLVQILATMFCFSLHGFESRESANVALLYYMGMAGHFSLGNSNTLATIDVAGAFIGLSSYSSLFSGMLMFIITYASPMLVLLSLVTFNSVKNTRSRDVRLGNHLKMKLGFPCLVPLSLNSILLTAYTVVLLLMRNHLFVWSVFSPKYLYVCASTVCIYLGLFVVVMTEIYLSLVLSLRKRMKLSINKRVSNCTPT